MRVGLLANFPPFEIWPPGGWPGGADLALLRALEPIVHLRFEPVRYEQFSQLQDDLRAGRIDLAGAMARTSERDAVLAFSQTYAVMNQALVTRRSDTSSGLSPDLAGRRLAVVKDYASQDQVKELFPLAQLVEVDSDEAGLDALQHGQADAMIEAQPVLLYLLAHRHDTELQIARELTLPVGALHFATGRHDGALIQEIDRGLDALAPAGRKRIVQAWTSAPDAVKPHPPLRLDAAQHTYLKALPELVVGVMDHQAPFSFGGADGQAKGLSVDLLRLTLQRLGLHVRRWDLLDEQDLERAAQADQVDVVVGMDETAPRRAYLQFVGPYLERPEVLVGRRGATLWSLAQVQGRRLAIAAEDPALPFIESRYPAIDIVPCGDLADCLRQVSAGRADVTLTDLITGAVRLSGIDYPDLQIVGVAGDLRRDQSFALSTRLRPLAPLLKSALDETVAADMPALKARWLSAADARRQLLQRMLHWAWLAVAIVLGLLLVWWWSFRRQRGMVRRTQAAQRQAERSEAATRRFVAFLAHEVRNSLHSVIAGAELLRSAEHVSPAIVASLGDSARATLGLLNTLLDRDRLEAGRLTLNLEVTRLQPVVETVAVEMRNAALAKGLQIRHRFIGDDQTLIEIDVLRTQQIVRNLVSNAIKYTRIGQITIETACRAATADSARVEVSIRVCDTGPGIAPDDLGQLFADYHTTDSSRAEVSSTGLGLALSKELAQLMGGDLTVESEVGRGSCFTLRWWAQALTPSSPAARRKEVAAPAPQKRALVVEDAEVYALLLERAFGEEGWSVTVADGVEDACRCLAEQAYDLLLSDLRLRDGDALQLLHAVRERDPVGSPVLPKVVMSAELEDVDVTGLYEAGAQLVITKSSNVMIFVRQLLLHPALRLPQGELAKWSVSTASSE